MRSQLTGLFCIIFLLAVQDSLAQASARKPDKIHRLDQTVVEGLIEEVNKSEVQYKKVNDPTGPLYAIPRKEIWKIIWNNGDEEQINPLVRPKGATQKPIGLLVKKKTTDASPWDGSGIYVGAQIGAGISLVPSSSGLQSGTNPGLSGGLSIGYHKRGIGLRLQANYTQVNYGVAVTEQMGDAVSSVTGAQSQLMLPLTATVAKKLGKIRITGALGVFSVFQLGSGALTVEEDAASLSRKVKNCQTCYSKDPGFGLTGGVGIRLIEKPTHALFVEANWYHHLKKNRDYMPGEKSVNVHLGLLSAGLLFHLPR